jgi:ABC-type microcin C transport system permease subunit YejB
MKDAPWIQNVTRYLNNDYTASAFRQKSFIRIISEKMPGKEFCGKESVGDRGFYIFRIYYLLLPVVVERAVIL